jgi:COP9 signalosome complex subunit 6
MLVAVDYKVETGEAERIAVDWSAKGGEGGGSCESILLASRMDSSRLNLQFQ